MDFERGSDKHLLPAQKTGNRDKIFGRNTLKAPGKMVQCMYHFLGGFFFVHWKIFC
jgi:hypothetical protein